MEESVDLIKLTVVPLRAVPFASFTTPFICCAFEKKVAVVSNSNNSMRIVMKFILLFMI
jgi:hypothetical protein